MRYAKVIAIGAAILAALAAAGCGGGGGSSSSPPYSDFPIWQAQIDFTKAGGVPWTEADFAALKRSRINRAEIDLDWGDLEPLEGQYRFKLLHTYLEDAN